MTDSAKRTMAAAVVVALMLVAVASRSTTPARGTAMSAHGVSVWVPEKKFQGDMTFVHNNEWQVISSDRLPRVFRGDPVIATETVLGAFDAEKGCVVFYTRKGDRLKKRGVARPYPLHRIVEYRLLHEAKNAGLEIEVHSEQNGLEYTLCLSRDGVIEFKPSQVEGLTISGCQVEYGIVPSFIGTDLVYDPRRYADNGYLYIPSLNLYTGLVKGSDCMMVGVWPFGDQVVKLGLETAGGAAIIDSFSIDTAKRSFYLSYLEHPNIWHAEVLKDTYLEKDTVISWRRPFDAKWIGRFFITSEGIDFPFYFLDKRVKMWGRWIRGWYYYPFWFDGDKTCVHFEKKFPPEGEALLYFLEKEKGKSDMSSPVEVMQKALGDKLALELLDFDGVEERLLLKHEKAVCAMTDKLQEIFDTGNEVKERAQVEQWADDIVTFIRLMRGRIGEYSEFTSRMKEFLETRGQADPELAESLQRVVQTLDEMQQARENGMPSASIEDVCQWTEEIKQLANEVREENSEQCKALGRKCRTLAGAQDDLARDLAALTIRVMEEVAEVGVASPKRVGLAQQVIAEARQTLRSPTCAEPNRYYKPKVDPGNP